LGCLLAGAARCRVCTDEKCKTHRQFSHYEISPQEREQRRKLALAVRVQKESRSRILHAVRQNLPRALARADFEMVALDYFRRLGHENHHRLFQVYGWEEKKTQTSWGGSTVDHERLAKGQIHEMTAGDINRFLVVCSLVSDLYCPGYSSAETLSKEANLMRTAARYRIDALKITTRVSAKLSAKRSLLEISHVPRRVDASTRWAKADSARSKSATDPRNASQKSCNQRKSVDPACSVASPYRIHGF
jgi:hypothetical protein